MAILKVARMGHPVLRARAHPVDPGAVGSQVIQKLIDDMIETMNEYQGIGLAAPQVHESLRLFVAGIEGEEDRLPPMVLVNPEVLPQGRSDAEDWEGCLSIPDLRGRVRRPDEILLRGLDRHGAPFEMKARGYPARVIQHEIDHLDGILFLDRMRSFETLTYLDEFARYWGESPTD